MNGLFEELLTPLFMTRWGRIAGWIALAVMLLIVLVTLIALPMNWFSDVRLSRQTNNANPDVKPVAADQGLDLIAEIPSWHLFGNAGQVTTDVPITSLQVRLVGVILATPNSLSSVIISEAGRPGKIYRVGDQLSGGIKVNAIIQDGVILENGGRLEKLPLQRQPLSFQGMPKKLLQEE